MNHWISRVGVCVLVMALACNSGSSPSQPHTPKRPHIVLIMADDMGYSDIGCYGSEIRTPTLDRLAQNGLRFRDFYNTAKCCPSRAALMTGLYQHEAGMGAMVSPPDKAIQPGPYQGFLNDSCLTIAEALQSTGYHTYMTGKWHLGERPQHWPRQRGFDRYFGLISGASSYYELIKEQPRLRQMAHDDDNWEPPKEGFYMTDAFGDSAVAFLEQHFQVQSQQPFFLNLMFNAPHWPLHAPKEVIDHYRGRYDQGWDVLREERYQRMQEMGIVAPEMKLSAREEGIEAWETVADKADWATRMEVYAAMIERMDQAIGKVVQLLEAQGALDNTLILFLTDNGGCAESVEGRKLHQAGKVVGERGSYLAYETPWANASNTPYRYYKNWMHEGGTRSPLIVHWPDRIAAPGRILTQPVAHIMDLMPTVLAAAKTEYPHDARLKPLRGHSLLSYLNGTPEPENRTLFWEFNGARAAREGDWKIVAAKDADHWELYNLADDPTELNDLSAAAPQKLAELRGQYQRWAREVNVRSQIEEE